MITPEFLEKITEQTEKTVTFMRTHILKRICRRIEDSLLANEENIMIPSTIKEIHNLMDTGMLQDDIQKEIEKALPNIKKEIRTAFMKSALEISNYNTDVAVEIIKKEGFDVEIPQFERVGLPKSTANLNLTATEVRKLEQIYKGSNRIVENMCRLLPVQGNEMYLRLSTEGFLKAQSGVPVGDVITQAIKDASSLGITSVNYNSGHIDKIEVAVARAVRTAIAKANAEIVLTRASEMGVEYVKVSEHYGARVTKFSDYTNHSIWQGKVYHLDWKNPVLSELQAEVPSEEKGFSWLRKMRTMILNKFKKKYNYPDFVDVCGYGKMLGICGINCRHTFSAFFPDVQEEPKSIVDDVDNVEFYKNTQKQREMERRIRKTKTELYNLESVDSEYAEQRIAYLKSLLQKQTDALFDFCEVHGFNVENWRLQIIEQKHTKIARR